MPVDFSLLMGPSEVPLHSYSYHLKPSFDPDIALKSGSGWRRSSSYPINAGSELCATKPTSFRLSTSCRSLSEMALPESLATWASAAADVSAADTLLSSSAPATHTITLGQLKEELAKLPKEDEVAVVEQLKRCKKRVVFADDKGHDLCEIRIMTEPSDVPPKLDNSILRALLGEAACEEARPCAAWKLSFPQPASEYMKFRTTLEKQNVALENVILRNEECTMNGTIKVRNLCYRKEVFVRLSDDGWASYKDFPALFSPSLGNSSNEVWETFSFHIQIPCDDEKREKLAFCICFRAEDGAEYWDSRGGTNFNILSEKSPSPPAPLIHHPTTNDAFSLPASTNLAQFSVWRDLDDANPYY